MRPYHKRQILETVKTLYEVLSELDKQLEPRVASGLVSECAEFARENVGFVGIHLAGGQARSRLRRILRADPLFRIEF